MRIAGAPPRADLLPLWRELVAEDAPLLPERLDQLVRRAGPELFAGSTLTGSDALRSVSAPPGGVPLLTSELGPLLGQDPRARAELARRTEGTQRALALAEGRFDRQEVEAAVRGLFADLARQGLPLEPRPGSALAEAFATGDFSGLPDQDLLALLMLLVLYGQNRHKPNAVAGQPGAAMAPRGSWPADGGPNRAGGGGTPTGLNRPAAPVAGPVPPAGDIPPGTPIGQRLAITARQVANDMNTTGWCYRGVARAVAQATGVQLTGGSAYMAADQLAASGRFREIRVAPDQLRDLPPGAVVVWGQTAQSPHGHISVALGNGQEASDHVQAQITSLRGASNYRVFVPN